MFTVALSSRSLFMLEEENRIFEAGGQEAFDQHMLRTASDVLEPGAAYGLVRKLLALNGRGTAHQADRVRVVLLSRNSPEAGLRVMNSVQAKGLAIESAVFTRGGNRFSYAKAMNVDLFLCASEKDVAAALEMGIAAAVVVPSPGTHDGDNTLKIALDGDSVLFDGSSDAVYREKGLEGFVEHETLNAGVPMLAGPFKRVAEKLVQLRREVPQELGAVRIALATMRSIPTHGRILTTLREWGMDLDELIMAGGMDKGPLLEAFNTDFFIDDSVKNVESASKHRIAAARVVGQGGDEGAAGLEARSCAGAVAAVGA